MKKKRFVAVVLFLCLLFSCIPPVQTNAATEGNYSYTVSDGKATITKCNQAASGNVVIPLKLGGYRVAAIGSKAFENCTNIVTLTFDIDHGITSIGSNAFKGCTGLTKVVFSGGGARLSISGFAFSGCTNLAELYIYSGVDVIDSRAFQNCDSLTTVVLSNSVTTIKSYAFESCDSLTGVTIPASVTSLDDRAFAGCYQLTSIQVDKANPNYSSDTRGVVFNKDKTELLSAPGGISGSYTIPDSVTSLGPYAFYDCDQPFSVVIPDSVTHIGTEAFNKCDGLTSVRFPNYVTYLGNSMFDNCPNLEYTVYDNAKYLGNEGNPYVFLKMPVSTDIASCEIAPGTTIVGPYAFQRCTNLAAVTIPDTVIRMGRQAFYQCSALKSVTIPSSMVNMSTMAFYQCTQLEKVVVQEGVTNLDTYAFGGCINLKTVVLPASMTKIWDNAFNNCNALDLVIYCGTADQWRSLRSNSQYFSGSPALENATLQYHDEQFIACTDAPQCTYCGHLGEIPGHNYEAVVTAPTCTEKGYTTHTCTVCNDSYVDTYVDANGHNYEDAVTVPTCATQGYTTHTCTVCGDNYADTYVEAGHSYESVVTAPTCTAQGYTTHTCAACGDSFVDTYVDTADHAYEEGVCTGCGDTLCTAHTWQEGVCTDCGQELAKVADLDGDGRVTAFDAQVLAEARAGLRVLTEEQWNALADLQSADIKDYILGKFGK